MITEKFTNVDNDVLLLLKDFFIELKQKIGNKEDSHYLDNIYSDLENFPNIPENNVFVSYEYENSIYYISFLDYKIELTNYLIDYWEDEKGNKNDYSTIQQYCFRYELGGYTEINGNFDNFREILLNSLKNVSLSEIELSDEEY
jgi:hypothetical protein